MAAAMDRVALRRLSAAALLAACACAARAHDVAGAGLTPVLGWSLEPWVLACLAVSALLYVLGCWRLLPKAGQSRPQLRRRAAYFALGWCALLAALVSPLDALGSYLFSAHMLQHELMMIVAAPLLVMARPFGVWTWALPTASRRGAAGVTRHGLVSALWQLLTWPLFAWLLHALVLWLWHAPVFFEAALHSNAVHTVQHISFLGSALLFWWAVLGDGTFRPRRGPAMLYIFTTMAHTGALGALLTWSSVIWYPSYVGAGEAFGMAALEDQQLGGLIMWVPGGLAYLFAGLALAARWLARTPSAPAPAKSLQPGDLT
jgi:putative membrane protein